MWLILINKASIDTQTINYIPERVRYCACGILQKKLNKLQNLDYSAFSVETVHIITDFIFVVVVGRR